MPTFEIVVKNPPNDESDLQRKQKVPVFERGHFYQFPGFLEHLNIPLTLSQRFILSANRFIDFQGHQFIVKVIN